MPAKLSHICLFTDDVQALTKFYEYVLDMPADSNLGSYVQFKTEGAAILAIWDIDEQNAKAPDSAEVRKNKSSILEFQVEDVDKEFERLSEYGVQWVKEPTTQPWGTRSTYFRDLDGNLVSFYSAP